MSANLLRVLFGLVCVGWVDSGWAQSPGPLKREPNTTLRLPQSPPAFGFTTEPAFGGLRFTNPVALASPPGESNRLFVVEQRGRIVVLTNLLNPTRTLFLDLSGRVTGGVPPDERGLLGLAFHPGYATNRLFYAFYTASGTGSPNRLSRFEVSPEDPNRALSSTEQILINQPDDAGNHNGGDLHFGPDGYLYVSLGDEGGGNDQYANSQRIDRDFFAGILRIDVDKRATSLPPNSHLAATTNYAIPADNPFVGATSFLGRPVDARRVRTEFYAVGLRNPWRIAFDRPTGRLYAGDVGQNLREEIDLIVKGGNYGWNHREGLVNGPRTAPTGFAAINPIFDYPRAQGISVTGGVVYRGSRFSQIYGHYLFADYGSGNIWSLIENEGGAPTVRRLAVDRDISAFGVDPANGDVLFADVGEDLIKRLVYSATPSGAPLPPRLSDTGAFVDLTSLTPQPGIVPYELNVPFWSDNARKRRWFSVPDANQVMQFSRAANWSFPTGTVWIKHFDLELTNGVPSSARRLETRFLVRNTNGIYGVTYRWDQSQQNANLVPEEGLDEALVVHDGGVIRTQFWHYPSRSECQACHTPVAGHALGFNTAQLNRLADYGGVITNQLRALSDAGYFAARITGENQLPALASAQDSSASLDYRVRSYLSVNCSQCHQPGGSALGHWDARLATPTSESGLIHGTLVDNQSNPQAAVVKPGSLESSMLLQRVRMRGPGQMPPLASSVVDQAGVDLLSAWITNSLPRYQSFAEWQTAHFGSSSAADAGRDADPDRDGALNYVEYLTGRNPLARADRWAVTVERNGNRVRVLFPRVENRGFDVQTAASLAEPIAWQSLEVAGNLLFFPAVSSAAVVEDSIAPSTEKFYRVRVFEP